MSTFLILLGHPEVEHGGQRRPLPAERRSQLLAYLALRRDWVARSELAALLWPGQRQDLAATNLRKALHFARALPWSEGLEMQSGLVRWRVDTDVQEVQAAQREGRIEQALQRCNGPLLDGLDDLSNPAWTDWLQSERAHQARRFQDLARGRLMQLDGEPAAAAALATRLLEADPLDEDALAALLAAQRALGQFEEQRQAYRSFALRLEEELGVEPSRRLRSLLVGTTSPPDAQATAAFAPGEGFLGRVREIDELSARLAQRSTRLLTVLGPGGVGKSSLLAHALGRLEPMFADGVYWIALDDLHDTPQVAARIVAELKLTPGPQQAPQALLREHLAQRHALLIFDNAEHLDDIARFAAQLLADAENLKICATSRVRLAVPGEALLPLGGLALPPPQATAAEGLASEAARLFVASALAVRGDFDARAQASDIAVLLRATGGLPLAVLLAAHWVRLLPVAEICAELERSLDVLDHDDAGHERPEHRSMRATLERSWQRLGAQEQRVLAELSVFVGSFQRHAAQQVCDAALPLLAALADKSLLQLLPGARCALHPLIRQFAADQLDEQRRTQAEHRHAQWYLGQLAQLSERALQGNLGPLAEIDPELENCRRAWRWAAANGQPHRLAACAVGLMRFFEQRGRNLEGLQLLQQAHAATCTGPNPPLDCAARLCAAIAHLQIRSYRLDEAAANARRGLAHARAVRAHGALALCLNVLGLVHNSRGEYAPARRFLQQAVQHAQAANDVRTALAARSNLAIVAMQLGDYALTERLMREVLQQERELGNWPGVCILLNNLAGLYTALARWPDASACIDEGIALSQAHGVAVSQPHLFVNRALVSCNALSIDEADTHGQQALAVARRFGNRGAEAKALIILARVATRRRAFDQASRLLHDALGCPPTLINPPLQQYWLLSYGQLQAAQGEAAAAGALLRYFLAQPDLEPLDRADAVGSLSKLPSAAAASAMPQVTLNTFMQERSLQWAPSNGAGEPAA